jgi:hypothetical protein
MKIPSNLSRLISPLPTEHVLSIDASIFVIVMMIEVVVAE